MCIEERRRADFVRQGKLIEWQTRLLAGMIASTAQTDQKGHKQLVRMVESIRFSTGDEDESEVDGKAVSLTPPDAAMTDEEFDEFIKNGNAEAAAERNTRTGAVDRFLGQAPPMG